MIKARHLRHLIGLVILFPLAASAEPRSFSSARSVLGQPNLNTEDVVIPPTQNSLNMPEGITVDPVSGKVFVADSTNNRILRFSSTGAYRTNSAAEVVFGQTLFSTNLENQGGAASEFTLSYPAALAMDDSGNLYVSDYGNNRVLRYADAANLGSGAAASAVIGQPDFATTTAAPASGEHSGFAAPYGVAVDSNGNLWVSDYELDRILLFINAAGAAFSVTADRVLGQPTLDTFALDLTTQTNFHGPSGVSVGPNGELWVADQGNHRILRFDDAINAPNGAPASGVLGQSNFMSGAINPEVNAQTFENPYYATAASNGTLWVSDYSRVRVLGFRNAALSSGLVDANVVLGNPTFTEAEHRSADSRSLRGPCQLAIGRSGSLLVAVYDQSRVVRFSDAVSVKPTRRRFVTKARRFVVRGSATGASNIRYRVAGQGGYRNARGTASRWVAPTRRLTRRTTRMTVIATAFDGVRSVSRVTIIRRVPRARKP